MVHQEAVGSLLGRQSHGGFTQVHCGGQFGDFPGVGDLQSIQRFGGVGYLLGQAQVFVEVGD